MARHPSAHPQFTLADGLTSTSNLLTLSTRSAPPAQFFPASCFLPSMFLGSSDPTGPRFNSAFPLSLLFLLCSHHRDGTTILPVLPGQEPRSRPHHHLLPFSSLAPPPPPPTPKLLSTLAKPHYLQLPELQTGFCRQAFVQAMPSAGNTPPSPFLPEDSPHISSSGSPP